MNHGRAHWLHARNVLFGWTTEPFEDGEGDPWSLRNRDGWLNGGMMALPAEGVAPHWQVSFSVDDAGAAVARAEELGGGVILASTPTAVGDIAVVHDPAGAAFGLFAGRTDP